VKRIALALAGLSLASGLVAAPAQATTTAFGTAVWSTHKNCVTSNGAVADTQIKYQKDTATGAYRATGGAAYSAGGTALEVVIAVRNAWTGTYYGFSKTLYNSSGSLNPPFVGYATTDAANYSNPAAHAQLVLGMWLAPAGSGTAPWCEATWGLDRFGNLS
jgi:hypothetical protein